MMGSKKIENLEMVVTDLDSTLFRDDKTFNQQDIETLNQLKDKGIWRAIATGRSLLSAKRVLPADFPIDYLIFSSGAGIVDWQTGKHLHSDFLDRNEVKQISETLISSEIDFMIHEIIPNNHKFVFHRATSNNSDFEQRVNLYREFCEPLNPETEKYFNACQLVAIFPNNNVELFNNIKAKFKDIKIIRTTSPLDHHSIWMEIFPIRVSKGHGVDWLCKHLEISMGNTLSVGNDYNDLDMLETTGASYVVSNAPMELKEKFHVCNSNMECGFTDAVYKVS